MCGLMPRRARIVIPDLPHHVTQRGNNGQDVFFVDDDRRVYLRLLRIQSAKFALEILGYCLMPNHIHVIVRPGREDSLAKAIGRTHLIYTEYINRMHNRTGHLRQNRFYSCPLGKQHFWRALRYIEQNPVRAGVVRLPWEYKWSSAAAHVDGKDNFGLLNLPWWQSAAGRIDWRQALGLQQDEKQIREIRMSTTVGRPLAGDAFMSKLETTIGKRLRPLPVGRPKKQKEQKHGPQNR